MKKEAIIKNLKKYWWAYLLGVVILSILIKKAFDSGLIGKGKKGPSRPDIDNSTALGLAQGLWGHLDFNKPICIGESDEYVQVLWAIFKTNQTIIISRPPQFQDINIMGYQNIFTFNNDLNNYIDYAVNLGGIGSSKSAGITYSGCINISDALKLGSAIIN